VSLSLKDPEASPPLLHSVRLEALYHFPLGLVLPLSAEYLLSYLLKNPTNPTIVLVFGVSKAFLGVGLHI
jgi:hypothetical protein